VIVGAENYFKVEHVVGAKQNANDWQAYLTGTLKVPADRVALLLDDDATADQIRSAAADKAAQVAPGGTLWFVFIGHGAPSKDGKDGLLVGIDAQQKAESLYSRSLSRNELVRTLSKGKQAKTVVLIDACFSGKSPLGQALVPGLQPLVAMRTLPLADNRMIMMTAARSDQFAGPLPGGSRPAFSYLALGALRGWAADAKGTVTASGLIDYARKTLMLSSDRRQTPELSTLANASAVLGVGREAGPDLAKLQREAAASSGKGFHISAANLPAVAKALAAHVEAGPRQTALLELAMKAPEAEAPVSAAAPVRATAGKAGIQWVSIPGGAFWMGSSDYPDTQPHSVTIKSFRMAKTEVTNKQYKACVDASCANAVIVGCGYDATAPVCSKSSGNTQQGLCDMAGNAWEWVEDWYNGTYNGAPTDGSASEDTGWGRVIRGGAWNDGSSGARAAGRSNFGPSFRGYILSFRPVR